MAARPATRLNRPRYDDAVVARMRRERLHPAVGQWDQLHLEVLRRGLLGAVERLPASPGPVLDLWCGAKPYEPYFPDRVIGVDLDVRFGSADVVAVPPLPFRPDSFAWAVCTQALHIVDDPQGTVEELRRMLRPGGRVIVTVPDVMLRAGPSSGERRFREEQLRSFFGGWEDVEVVGAGGPGAAFAHAGGMALESVVRKLGVPGPLARVLYAAVNVIGSAVEVLTRPLRRRFPHILVLTARVPRG
jgi:SAM-dependent methyltransferase